jgi:DNA-binding GntR family transcriptional regulator
MTEAVASRVRAVGTAKLSAVDLAAAEIRRSILSGDLAPGQPFSVSDLAGQLHISHIPVREALRRLEVEGLVLLNPARSAVVAPLDVDDLRAIYQLRIQLEPRLAARSTSMRDLDGIDELRRLWADAFGTDVDPEVQWHSHAEFHLRLVEPAASPWDLRFLRQLWAAAERYTRLVFDPSVVQEADRGRRAAMHRALLTAVEAADGPAAEGALRVHLVDNLSSMQRRIEQL